MSRSDGCYCHIRHSLPVPGCLCCRWAGIYRWATAETRIGGRANVPALHTQALAGRGKTCRWMSAAAGASGDRVLASMYETQVWADEPARYVASRPYCCTQSWTLRLGVINRLRSSVELSWKHLRRTTWHGEIVLSPEFETTRIPSSIWSRLYSSFPSAVNTWSKVWPWILIWFYVIWNFAPIFGQQHLCPRKCGPKFTKNF